MFLWRVYEFSFDFGLDLWKMGRNQKIWEISGSMPRHSDPTQKRRSALRRGMSTRLCGQVGGLDKPRVR